MLFLNGDNFDSYEEYSRRYYALNTVAEEFYHGKLIVDGYDPKAFDNCEDCIRYRLTRTAEVAKSGDYDCFTTTLTISPHKDSAEINRIGREVGEQTGIPFLGLDLKKAGGFGKSVHRSREIGIYRQSYCGCKKSVRE
jgi:hypothetical protein